MILQSKFYLKVLKKKTVIANHLSFFVGAILYFKQQIGCPNEEAAMGNIVASPSCTAYHGASLIAL